MDINEFFDFIKIPTKYIKDDSGVVHQTKFGQAYELELVNSDAFSAVYSILSNIGDLEFDGEYTKFDDSTTVVRFYKDQFEVLLEANFDTDEYAIIVTEDSDTIEETEEINDEESDDEE